MKADRPGEVAKPSLERPRSFAENCWVDAALRPWANTESIETGGGSRGPRRSVGRADHEPVEAGYDD